MNDQYPYGQPGSNPEQFGAHTDGNIPGSYQAAYGAHPTQPVQPYIQQPASQPSYAEAEAHPAHASSPTVTISGVESAQPYGSYATAHTPSEGGAEAMPSTTPPLGVDPTAPVIPTTPGAPKGTKSKTFLIAFAGALLACILAFGVYGVFGARFGSGTTVTLGSSNAGSIEAVDAEASLAEAVAEKCLPSVVSIDVYANSSSANSTDSIYNYFYGYGYDGSQDDGLAEASLGSGVVLSEDGYVITNYHVVEGGTAFKVTIEGDVYDAELIGQDASSDVAVLKVDGSGFTPIELADSDDLTIGEWVMAIGSPFGLEQSVSTGIISATSRSQIMDSSAYYGTGSGNITIYPNMIQTDAAINPGNSGGALVDANGQLIGINTLITSYSGNYSGVGFAIPVNYAVNIAQSLIAGEVPTHAYLGVSLTTVNASTAERYGFTVDAGAYVSSVVDGSPAASAGIKVGDIITSFDEINITSASDLMLQVRTKKPGDTVKVVADRDGQSMDFDVTLGSTPTASEASSTPPSSQNNMDQNPNTQNPDSGSRSGGSGSGSGLEDLFRQFGN